MSRTLVRPACEHIAKSWVGRSAFVMDSIETGQVHLWRVPLADCPPAERDWTTLSDPERARAHRFHFDRDRHRFVQAHAALRRVLSTYTNCPAGELRFTTGVAGKPALQCPDYEPAVEFNLSHSGDFALVAVAATAVGVDVERWDDRVEFLELANHYFSPREREDLSRLAGDAGLLQQGFFQAWTRKEAYLKATGMGITHGLHHFDVTLAPGAPAALLADRADAAACQRWVMQNVAMDAGYSAAVVVAGPLRNVELRDIA